MDQHVRGILRWSVLAALVCVSLSVSGCGKSKDVGPAEHFERILAHLREGSLAEAYAAFMPESYDRDLQRTLERAKALVAEEEFHQIRDFAKEAGGKMADALDARGDSLPLLRILSKGLRDVPGLLGIPDYQEFRAQDVRGLLSSIDSGLFRELAAANAVRDSLAGAAVSLRETRGSWAKLRFSMRDAGGESGTEDHEMIVVDGKWVPNSWAVDWPGVVKAWNDSLDDFAREKAANPGILSDSLKSARTLSLGADDLVLDLLRRLGVAESPENPGEP